MVRHPVDSCICGESLADIASIGLIKRQVFDIPLPTVEVTEHQTQIKVCPCCGQQNTANFPAFVTAPVQYGSVIQSVAVYLKAQQLLPENRLQQTLSDLFNVAPATATLNSFSETVYAHLSEFEQTAYDTICMASLKHLDETGFRIAGKTQWLPVASNESWTYYRTSPRRKSLLGDLQGFVVHDHWKPYYQLDNVKHVLCNAHHLRELKSLMEDGERWVYQMWLLLRLALRIKHHYLDKDKPMPQSKQQRLFHLYNTIVQRELNYHEALPPYGLLCWKD